MRLSRPLLKQRVNALPLLRFNCEGLTSFSGLELFRSFFRGLALTDRLRSLLADRLPGSDYPGVGLILLLLALLLTGGRRLAHLRALQHDPVVARFCGLSRLPAERSVSRWLAKSGGTHVDALKRVNDTVTSDLVHGLNLRRLTLDIDGSVVSTGLKVEGARRGYNPHRRKVPSYYPITAYEAQSGLLLKVQNRAGNVHDGHGALAFIDELLVQLKGTYPEALHLEFGMDGSFFLKEIFERMDASGAEYTIKVPFWKWLDLQSHIRTRKRWQRVQDGVDCFEVRLPIKPWRRRERVVIYRKHVRHRTARNFQLDLFDPDTGTFEYSAIATNKVLTGAWLWTFMNGRGTHEKVYGELKSGFAFDSVPSMKYHGNSAWQVLSVLAFNLSRALQASQQDARNVTTPSRRARFIFQSIRSLRFQWLNLAGLLVHPCGKTTLDVGTNPVVRQHFSSIASSLDFKIAA
ncbi:MAG: IS1380 family transposase [Gammaproteobacteria bacterium]|nr:IS1380 family transposase [Gammaproteobacteria bacterium]